MQSIVQKRRRVVSLDEALALPGPVVCVVAPVGCGKTEFVVQKAAQLVSEGTAPEKILCIASTPTAALRLQERLRTANPRLARVQATTVLQAGLTVLGTEGAYGETGREPRLLCGAEFNMLVEDMKLHAGSIDQLRGFLAKLPDFLSGGVPEKGWGLDAEEKKLYQEMDVQLKFLGALIREEVSPLAAGFLEAHRGERGGYDAVLVDDAHNLSAASLALCRYLAKDYVAFSANPNQASGFFDCGASTEAFRAIEDDVGSVQLEGGSQPEHIAAFCDALCSGRGMDESVIAGIDVPELPDEQVLACVKWHEPADEFRGVADTVRMFLNNREGADAGDIFVLVPNRVWAQAIQRELDDIRVDSVAMLDVDPVSGDPRSESPGTLEAYCLLSLAADANDLPAWRLWLGLGDATCCRQDWHNFQQWSCAEGLSGARALKALGAGEGLFEGSERLRERYLAGLATAEGLAQRRGFSLLKALAQHAGGREVGALLEPIEGTEDAAELHARLVEMSLSPYVVPSLHRVTIGSYRLVQGLDPRYMIACGLTEGYVPEVTHEHIDDPQFANAATLGRRLFYNAAGKARNTLVLSWAQRAEEEVAAKLHLDFRRKKREHGRNVVVLQRSPFLDEVGAAAPSTVSGEQYLSSNRKGMHHGRT